MSLIMTGLELLYFLDKDALLCCSDVQISKLFALVGIIAMQLLALTFVGLSNSYPLTRLT